MARVERIDPDHPDPHLLRLAADLILNDEVVVCPTDTGYAFGANALSEFAIERVFALKGRSLDNPIHIAVGSIEEASRYAIVPDMAAYLMRRFLPGGLTLVLLRKDVVPARLVGGRNSVGIRIPDNRVILGLVSLSGVPVTTTSANLSGRPTPYDVAEVSRQEGKEIELVLDQGPLPAHGVSTIIDLSSGSLRLLRPGVIGIEKIKVALESFSRA